jgi:hypothetical protein
MLSHADRSVDGGYTVICSEPDGLILVDLHLSVLAH